MKSLFIYSSDMGRFDFGHGHPFKPERGIMTFDLCHRYGLINAEGIAVAAPPPAPRDVLLKFHQEDYLDALEAAGRGEVSLELLSYGLGTEDNPIRHGIDAWAARTVGGSVMGMEKILAQEVDLAFNVFGGFHHGYPDHAEGFCYLNDIATAINVARTIAPGLRLAYVDADAHHGNALQDAFYATKDVLVISLHETGREIYPGTGMETEIGSGEGRGYNVNIPLEPGTDDEVYQYAFEAVVVPLLTAYQPQVLIAQVGADVLVSDPLTHLKLTNNGYRRYLESLRSLCPRILALSGGGYDLYRSARAWTLAWAALTRREPEDGLAGLVGGMMFGPEMEMGSLYDHPYFTTGESKEKAMAEARRVVTFLRENVFPCHGL
jgi:acetoin utilization protein AcuC